jgi:hypothetical protein
VFSHALGKRIISPVDLGVEPTRRTNNVVPMRSAVNKRPERKRSRTAVQTTRKR